MKSHSMYKTLILQFVLFPFLSHAFSQMGELKIQSIDKKISEAVKNGVGITKEERRIKRELVQIKKEDKKNKTQKFEEKLKNKLSNTTEYQGYLEEIEAGLPKMEQAKLLAKQVALENLRKNKTIFTQSSANAWGTLNWNELEAYYKQSINTKTVYNSTRSKNENGLAFDISEWGRVLIANNLKSAKWQLDISSQNDTNRMEPEALKIKIKGEESEETFGPEDWKPQTTPVVPILGDVPKTNQNQVIKNPAFNRK